ncbi:DUF4886 domain-containing protein [Cerasicoccus fimbriatus]|uniref:DUF4886 domain-containing protein n=1 Tax=Cerasicoccus fimbriatus TaxID=3014554 RepID=UPI0022B5BC58|nr:DUF4886 domain-containing protein [Cerasicoccus sp. TK19100]
MKALYNHLATTILALVTLTNFAGAENKVLFLGNSFTLGSGGARNVPDIFDALARAAGQEDPTTAIAAVRGKDFQYHYENHQTEIASQPWTHVVMQNYSTEPTHIGNVSEHMTYGTLLYGSILANNPDTQVHLYQTWARAAIHSLITGTSTSSTFESTDEMLNELVTNYQALADSLNTDNPSNPAVKVNPVGQAWDHAGGNLHPSDPNYIDLFDSDDYHGNSLGYYLSACVHYAAIYQDSPVDLYNTAEVTALNLNLKPSEAAFVENIAWQTVVAAGLAEDLSDTTPPTWTGLTQADAKTLVLRFDDRLDETTARDPANYTIINRGNRIAIESVALANLNSSVTLTTATELVGNVLVEVSAALRDNAGNTQVSSRRISLQATQSPPNLIYVDFGGANTVSGSSDVWNQVALEESVRNAVGNSTATPAELLGNLRDSRGMPTGISLSLADAPTGTNGEGATSGPYPSGATADSLYGQNGTFAGFTDNGKAVFLFSNLDPETAYDFTFYASRTSVSDNRETKYTLTGATSQSATLNAANNVSSTAKITDMQPNASGEITLTISKGANNTNSNGFYYIGTVVIGNQASRAPVLYRPVSLGNDYIIDWSGTGQLWTSENLSNWSLVSPQPIPPYEDPISPEGCRFYLIQYD